MKRDGRKKIVNGKALTGVGAYLAVGVVAVLVADIFAVKDTSRLEMVAANETPSTPNVDTAAPLPGIVEKVPTVRPTMPYRPSKRVKRARVAPIRYSARQVFYRRDSTGGMLPIGSKMDAKLATAIDTRFPGQLIQAVLVKAAAYRGAVVLPVGTELFGKLSYSGRGKRVFVDFTRGITPTGREFTLSAQALGKGELSPGLTGTFHGNADGRAASTMGLAAAAGAAEVLTQKESLGTMGEPTPRATLKNALLRGAVRAGEMELAREMGRIAKAPEYVTIAAGRGLIVILTETLKVERMYR